MRPLRYLDPRRSFAARLAATLVAIVALLLVVTLLVVRSETEGQIELVTERAVNRATEALAESEERRRQQLAQRASTFTDTRRTAALVEAAIAERDTTFLVAQVEYALRLTHFDDASVMVLTDPRGDPVLSIVGDTLVAGDDPIGIRPYVRQLLDTFDPELFTYRVVDGRLYTLRLVLIELGGRVVGATAFGLPIRDADAEAVSRLVGAEVCFVAAGECLAGTPRARSGLASLLAGIAGATTPVMSEYGDERWELIAQPLGSEASAVAWLSMSVPLEEVLAPFDRIRRALALAGVGGLVLALGLSVMMSRGLTRPVRGLVGATVKVGRGDYDVRVPDDSPDELGQLARSFNHMTEGLALKEQYRGVLDKVVSPDVAAELMRGELRLGGESREVSVLFADIRGFTALTEGMEPQAVIGLLNETMERLGTAVEENGGVVDKYVGDEIMAVFGAPLRQPDHAARAVRAARSMLAAMEEVNAGRVARGEAGIGLGVGVHTGVAVAGNMGSANRLNYTVVGAAVNLAARLCSAAAGGEVLISGETRARLPADLETRPAGERELKGFSRRLAVYTVDPERAAGHASGRGSARPASA